MKRSTLPITIAVGAVLLVAACSDDPEPTPALPPVASAPAAAPSAAAPAPAAPAPAAPAPTVDPGAAAQQPAAPAPEGMNSYTAGEGQPGWQDGAVTLEVVESERFGKYVVDGRGFTLYRFDPDNANPPKATCNDDCAVTWPPVPAMHEINYKGLDQSAIGYVQRDDGSAQITIGNWPVYAFSKDTEPRQSSGEGVGGTWFVVAPDGQKASQD